MHIRLVLKSVLSAVCLCLMLQAAAMAGTIFTIRAGATETSDTFPTLEALRLAIAQGRVQLVGDTQIFLHNSDDSLTAGITVPDGVAVTVRGAGGGRQTISGNQTPFVSMGNKPIVRYQNVGVTNAGAAIRVTNTDFMAGELSITDSTVTGGLWGVATHGNMNATISNSIVNGGIYGNGSLNLNIVFDGNAAALSTWKSAIIISDNGTLNVNVASGKVFELQGILYNSGSYKTVYTDNNIPPDVSIKNMVVNKNGNGTWKLRGGGGITVTRDPADINKIVSTTYHLIPTLNINEGRVYFGSNSRWAGQTINVGSQGVFKIHLQPGNLIDWLSTTDPSFPFKGNNPSHFILDNFHSVEGARMEIGGISEFPTMPVQLGTTHWTYGREVIHVGAGNTLNSTFASSMNIDNKLLKVTWRSGKRSDDNTRAGLGVVFGASNEEKDGWWIHIEKVNNLNILDGLGSFADVYRMMKLSDAERDMLDTIYCSGSAGDSLGYLQTVGGYVVQNSMLAMRHNQANMVSKMHQRLTKYHADELEVAITGGEACGYSDYEEIIRYGELWAYIDQTWMRQRDIDNIAGYRYQAHTVGLGYDWHRDNLIFGGVASYAGGKLKMLNNTSTRNDIENVMLALYASWAQDGLYMTGAALAGYGWNDATSNYTLSGLASTTAKTGNYATSMLGANLETGYMMETTFRDVPIRVTPYGGITYARLHRNAVRESGGHNGFADMNRQFRSSSWPIWEVSAGVRLAMPIDRGGYTLIPTLDAAWTRTMGEPDDKRGSDAWFVDRPGFAWRIPVMASNRSSLRVAAGMEARIRDNLSIAGGYNFEWRDNYWSHQVNMNMSLGF